MHHARRRVLQPVTLGAIVRKTELQVRAKKLREKLKPVDPLDDFNYVGSRHHY
jgi:hypothetical protein